MYTNFGIDRATINHIEILEVDFNRLKKYKNVSVVRDNGRFTLPNGEVFKTIVVDSQTG